VMDGWVRFCFGESANHPVIVEPPPRAQGKAYPWTAEQVEMIRQYYPTMGGNAVAEMVGAPSKAVKDKAYRLGLRVTQARMIEAKRNNTGNFGNRSEPVLKPGR